MTEYICVNGNLVSRSQAAIPVIDRGFLYGYGLFETLRVLTRGPVFWEEHMQRLEDSALQMGLHSLDRDSIKDMIFRTIEANKLYDGSLRVTVTAGAQRGSEDKDVLGPNVVVTTKHGIPYSDSNYRLGFRAGFLEIRRNENSPLVRLKTLNYLENILGRQEAFRFGWDEGIFLNNRGYLCEGTVSNLFLVGKGELLTPETGSGLLPGIVRKKVMDLALENNMQVKECRLKPRDLYEAEEAFLTNSLMGVMPLIAVNEKDIGSGAPGLMTQLMIKEYNRLLYFLNGGNTSS